MEVNVLGTWHVLLAAEAADVKRVICFSSLQALGVAEGERLPDYFPVDDRHPRRAMRPYGLSKRLAEDLCEAFTRRTGIATLSLRPVTVWTPGVYERVERQRRASPASEWEPFWEYGAFVDVRDVAGAVERALDVTLSGHHRALLCAADIAASAPSLQMAGRLAPTVPVRDSERYQTEPWRSLVDCATAATVLGWQPVHRWSQRGRPELRGSLEGRRTASAVPRRTATPPHPPPPLSQTGCGQGRTCIAGAARPGHDGTRRGARMPPQRPSSSRYRPGAPPSCRCRLTGSIVPSASAPTRRSGARRACDVGRPHVRASSPRTPRGARAPPPPALSLLPPSTARPGPRLPRPGLRPAAHADLAPGARARGARPTRWPAGARRASGPAASAPHRAARCIRRPGSSSRATNRRAVDLPAPLAPLTSRNMTEMVRTRQSAYGDCTEP